jgi:HlyD family secretion protein
MRRVTRYVWRVLFAAGLLLVLALAFWPSPIAADLVRVERGTLRVTIDEEGRTRVRERFVVSAPIAGQVLRIDLQPGDPVTAGQTVVATFQPGLPTPLDARARAEAQSRVRAADATLERARAARDQQQTEHDLAEAELTRYRQLFEAGLIPPQQLDAAVAETRARADALRGAESAVRAAQFDREAAQAALLGSGGSVAPRGAALTIRAPVTGVVLRRLRESEAVVAAGEPLIEIGDPRALEVVADLLSADAVNVRPGHRVIVEGWGGGEPLGATVRRVEPSGFTKISALGVEEQRVNVIIDFDERSDSLSTLGDAYRVEVRIILWEENDVLQVPVSSLFRIGDQWAVFVVEGERAAERRVHIGQRTPLAAEVITGLAEGDEVILHPSDAIRDGVRVVPR